MDEEKLNELPYIEKLKLDLLKSEEKYIRRVSAKFDF